MTVDFDVNRDAGRLRWSRQDDPDSVDVVDRGAIADVHFGFHSFRFFPEGHQTRRNRTRRMVIARVALHPPGT